MLSHPFSVVGASPGQGSSASLNPSSLDVAEPILLSFSGFRHLSPGGHIYYYFQLLGDSSEPLSSGRLDGVKF